jgi:hypothetical protein
MASWAGSASAGFLHGILFYPEDGDMNLQNIDISLNYTVSQCKTLCFSIYEMPHLDTDLDEFFVVTCESWNLGCQEFMQVRFTENSG